MLSFNWLVLVFNSLLLLDNNILLITLFCIFMNICVGITENEINLHLFSNKGFHYH